MENSFVDYRDENGAQSDSDTEIIDDSLVVDQTFSCKKKLAPKNQTVFVAESEESVSGDDVKAEDVQKFKSVIRRSSVQQSNTVISSDDDSSKRGSIRRPSETSSNKVIISSSDEEEMSAEMVHTHRPARKTAPRLSESFIGRKTKKRMMVLDSDTDNSFIIEQERRGKQACIKATPAKLETAKDRRKLVENLSFEDDCDSNHEEDESSGNTSNHDNSVSDPNDSGSNDEEEHRKSKLDKEKKKTKSNISDDNSDFQNDDENNQPDDDSGPDEDQMVLSRATRMSILGFIPKENESDDSDYIQSDDTKHTSHGSMTNSAIEIPSNIENDVIKTPEEEESAEKIADTSRLTCSPFASPLRDITNEINHSPKNAPSLSNDEGKCDVSISLIEGHGYKGKSSVNSTVTKLKYTEKVIDDEVTIIDTPTEIIALSSDDEDVVQVERSPGAKRAVSKVKSEDSAARVDSDIKQYLVPASRPGQVVYVKKHVRENELAKLNGLREELQNIRYLLEHMELESLPDGGARLIERLAALERDARRQGDKVAAMLVEPDEPTVQDIARDGFDGKAEKTPTWEEIQKASNAVQPRMFGKHAMATHLAERNLIMDRLRDLHASLATRPGDEERARRPRAVRAELMPHQLHALAWARWRETQRPPGGLLADDMGLGKTITMISLVALDKEEGGDDDNDDDLSPRGKGVSGGTLVVCPASLAQQWADEVRVHCAPHSLSVAVHHGAARALHAHRLAAADIVITTYNILMREMEKGGPLSKVRWRRAVLDEAHAVRNHKSSTAGAVCAVRARRRWALTGTPLHNRDLDLYALLKYLRCSPFDDLAMWKKWIDNKSVGGEERLSMMMRCLMLRRTKAQLQGAGQLSCLPARAEHERAVTLAKEEMNVYQKVLVSSKTLFAQYLQQRDERRAGGAQSDRDSAYALHKKMAALQGVKPVKSHEILVLLLRLRQMCCHCGLVRGMLNDQGDDEEAAAREDPAAATLLAELDKLTLDETRAAKSGARAADGLADASDGEGDGTGEGEGEGATVSEVLRAVLSPNDPVFDLSRPSAKIAAVMECLETHVFPNKGEKAVVVSQWTSVLRLVAARLEAARVRCVTLSGAVPVAARARLVAQLNDAGSDVRVMLLSLCAGGVGLNLCGASHLLLLDPHWNPQLERQAQDRVYRVGQARPVHVYRFTCVDTVEQSIRALQRDKLQLADSILTGARNTNASKLTIDDLKLLFNMGAAQDHH